MGRFSTWSVKYETHSINKMFIGRSFYRLQIMVDKQPQFNPAQLSQNNYQKTIMG